MRWSASVPAYFRGHRLVTVKVWSMPAMRQSQIDWGGRLRAVRGRFHFAAYRPHATEPMHRYSSPALSLVDDFGPDMRRNAQASSSSIL